MKQFRILSRLGAFALVNIICLDYIDYIADGYTEVFAGNKRDCLTWLHNHWDENEVLEEDRIFLTVKD